MTDTSMHQVDPRYQMAIPNNLASRLVFSRLQTDKRSREALDNNKTQNIIFKVINKCKGCAFNMLKDRQSYIGRYLKYAIIRAIFLSEKLEKSDQLLVPFSIFENTYRGNEYVGNLEFSLEKLETFQKIRDKGVKNLVFYMDGSLKVEEESSSNMPSSTKPELLAIWVVLLVCSKESVITIVTNSLAAINISQIVELYIIKQLELNLEK
ncbi:43970_t:CDS:2, partial [Gigaspora margarita]